MAELRETPLTSWHRDHGAKMADFAGYAMPISYGNGIATEHREVRENVGVFDVSHMGVATWPTTETTVANRVLGNDLDRLGDGEAQYTTILNERGGIVDDLIVTRMGGDFLAVLNAANVAVDVDNLRAAGVGLTQHDRAILAVQGPRFADVLNSVGVEFSATYLTASEVTTPFGPLTVSRTGYTGAPGVEVVAPRAVALTLWQAIVSAGASPCGLGCRDTLRLEMGYPLHGQDLSAEITPVEAGLSWSVGWNKTDFLGRETLIDQRATGPTYRAIGVRLLDKGVPRAGMQVVADGEEVGQLTSGGFSPTLGIGIGLARIRGELAQPGRAISVSARGRSLVGELVKPPFVAQSPRDATA